MNRKFLKIGYDSRIEATDVAPTRHFSTIMDDVEIMGDYCKGVLRVRAGVGGLVHLNKYDLEVMLNALIHQKNEDEREELLAGDPRLEDIEDWDNFADAEMAGSATG